MNATKLHPPKPRYVPIFKEDGNPNSGLLARLDVERWVLELRDRQGNVHTKDIARIIEGIDTPCNR